jgi:ATP-dependent RNA helicase RhlE
LTRREHSAPTLPTPADSGSPALPTGFLALPLGSALQRAIAAAGYRDLWPIQAQTIPAALAGRDVLGLSKTGSGKTAAFALPILARILARKADGPRALIIAPTRELATQIDAHVRTLAEFTHITTATVFGGVSDKHQISACRARPDIVIACPGRLLDLWNRGAVDLRRIETLVIDEADHMFDLGFLPDVKRILAALPAQRQNLLFSATMPKTIRSFADRLLRNPHVIELTNSKPASTIDHVVCPVAEEHKLATLRGIVSGSDFKSAIVFARTKRRAKQLADRLDRLGHRAIALQGNMSQPQRERAMKGFSSGRFDILVATDIAARGIDVAGVTYVVNFDVPWPPESYVHRIGRTGRAEKSGRAVTFATPSDAEEIRAIERMLGAAIPRTKLAHAELTGAENASLSRTASAHRAPHRRNGSHNGAPHHARKSNHAAPKREHRRPPSSRTDRHARSEHPQRTQPQRTHARSAPNASSASSHAKSPLHAVRHQPSTPRREHATRHPANHRDRHVPFTEARRARR